MSLTITLRNNSDAHKLLETIKSQPYPITLTFTSNAELKRTESQNRSLHKWCAMIAEELNMAGYDVRTTLKSDFDVPWSGNLVKELMWKPVQKALQGIESTTKANRVQYTEVCDAINRHLGTTKGVSVPWPCKESQNGSD